MEPEVVNGIALAVALFGIASVAAAVMAGGNVAMIALGLILAGLSMDLFNRAQPPDEQ